ncbi:peptidoglycan-binding protein [Paludisphaera rhizosphaerae]|uniref:peptidoglycan-binding protein n=1 Tax=Paludisphaera rhizosphaerae TaxID=2711216 RepID=UPI0013ED2232|nr:peptidoglycan-binding protein [Paludisphaera rhizosphaerae]
MTTWPGSNARRPSPLTSAAILGLVFLSVPAADATAQAPAGRQGRERSPSPGLKLGDTGSAVEDLQRRLNKALNPSPGLDDDGDFGEATRTAVIRFQREKNLPSSGVVDATTRSALGTEPLPEPEIPPPSVVNAQTPAKQPADSLDGPPFVSAKSWAILDGKTGEVLWGDRKDEPLPMASTTKMMTALIVGRIVAKDPKALSEVITFSERADRTPGSTSGVRAGEKVSVEELLYGMMLPSGNDATVAFGEHFGDRFPGAGEPLARFIAEMNRTAAELGLKNTRFANTHGLPADDHHASTADLARLAWFVQKDPLLARVVSTPKRGCTLEDGQGNKRNVVWSNTNRLLGTEGYDGVKTGTTNAAGNCLVASGRRGDDHVIIAILGAPTTDGRYLDARNLFRWAWNQRKAKDSSATAGGR